MTFSIVARDRDTGQFGVAVTSRFFACGALVPHVAGNSGAIATQAWINPLWGIEGAKRLAEGERAHIILMDFIKRDPGQALRQCHMIDRFGGVAAHTGKECLGWRGHITGDSVSIAGSTLTGPEVIEDALDTFQWNKDKPLAERLLLALQAGEQAGSDTRGRQSAALLVHRDQDYPWVDLRVDDHEHPVAELERLLHVAQEAYLDATELMATRENFGGVIDVEVIKQTLAKAHKHVATQGNSRSRATDEVTKFDIGADHDEDE